MNHTPKYTFAIISDIHKIIIFIVSIFYRSHIACVYIVACGFTSRFIYHTNRRKIEITVKERERKYIRLEVLGRIQTLREELEDMSTIVKDEMLTEDAKDEDIEKLNDKIKELEQQIVKILEE